MFLNIICQLVDYTNLYAAGKYENPNLKLQTSKQIPNDKIPPSKLPVLEFWIWDLFWILQFGF